MLNGTRGRRLIAREPASPLLAKELILSYFNVNSLFVFGPCVGLHSLSFMITLLKAKAQPWLGFFMYFTASKGQMLSSACTQPPLNTDSYACYTNATCASRAAGSVLTLLVNGGERRGRRKRIGPPLLGRPTP